MSQSREGRFLAVLASIVLCASPAAAIGVDNLNDSGSGSLRQAVLDANGNPGADVITFAPALSGTIHLTSQIAITDAVDIQGPGAPQLAVDSTARIFDITAGPVTISGLTLTGASASGNGGAISNASSNSGDLTLRAVSLAGNNATGEGGAIYHNMSGPDGGVLTIDSSTLSGNTASKAGAIYSVGYNLVIVNSTIAGNHATDSVGAVKVEFGFATIENSTIAGNTATFSQGGVLAGTGNVQLDLVSSIFADNTDGAGGSDLQRFNGTVNASYCLVEAPVGGPVNGTATANLTGVDPALGPLGMNGGPTDTLALAPGSPAIDTGSNPLVLPFDQRGTGFARVYGSEADIGAFEYQVIPVELQSFSIE